MLLVGILHYQQVFVRVFNALVVQKENCVVEEIKEVELRSRRRKFIL